MGSVEGLGEVPVLDLGALSASEAAALLDSALKRYGFFYVRNHGIPEELLLQQARGVLRSVRCAAHLDPAAAARAVCGCGRGLCAAS